MGQPVAISRGVTGTTGPTCGCYSPGMAGATVTSTLAVLAAVGVGSPVPWARSQMAFTLAFHIILVPLGVSWAFMTLIANYRAVRHHDADALVLAQRWSKYMAVTFAVGAVTGTVLSFEFGLLWPRFMGTWGEAFGVPFAFEGLFFFTEAIFVAIYIFGWRRLRPWTHFWTGVPIAVAGIFGAVSVVAANAWMNAPSGFTLNSAGEVVDVDPLKVIFNDAMPLQAAHMVVAAYLVGGFLVASVYAVGMLRGRTDRYHRLGLRHRLHGRRRRDAGPDDGRRRARTVGVQRTAGQVRRHRAGSGHHVRRTGDSAGASQRRTTRSSGGSRSRAWPRGCPTQHGQVHGRRRAGERPGRPTADGQGDQRGPSLVGCHGRRRDPAVPAVACGTPRAGSSVGGCRRAGCSCSPRRAPASWPW